MSDTCIVAYMLKNDVSNVLCTFKYDSQVAKVFWPNPSPNIDVFFAMDMLSSTIDIRRLSIFYFDEIQDNQQNG